MTFRLSRRDFLKWITLGAAALAARPLASHLDLGLDASAPNVFVFVFDAWCAKHLQMFGYPRDTMPNLTRFAEHAFVYHNHIASGSFTVPGTASLLTGLQPWTHRAVQLTAGGVSPAHKDHNAFAAFSKNYNTVGYTQNPYADIFLYQFEKHLDTYIPEGSFNLERRMLSSLPIFGNDAQMAFASFENNIIRNGKGTSGSLYLGLGARLGGLSNYAQLRRKYLGEYPAGVPIASGVFLLDDLVDGLSAAIREIQSPTISYFHVYPPHEPYAPRREFSSLFDDGWMPVEKPVHRLSRARHPWEEILVNRLRYDQFLAAWDAEFGRLLEEMQASGQLDKSIIVITSDHGELFERGEIGHNSFVFSNPIVHVPLFISLPGQTERKDFHEFTSAIDVLPTLAHLVGVDAPAWVEGRLLPGLGGEEDSNRGIFALDAKTASSFSSFNQYSISITRQRHRLIRYQYLDYEGYEFYNLEDDPEELKDLFPSKPSLAVDLKNELDQTIADFNRPYEQKQ
jgi:arylsulfatase A-like enzyme